MDFHVTVLLVWIKFEFASKVFSFFLVFVKNIRKESNYACTHICARTQAFVFFVPSFGLPRQNLWISLYQSHSSLFHSSCGNQTNQQGLQVDEGSSGTRVLTKSCYTVRNNYMYINMHIIIYSRKHFYGFINETKTSLK